MKNRQAVWAVNKTSVFFLRINMTATYLYADEPVYRLGKIMKLEKDNGIKPLYRKKAWHMEFQLYIGIWKVHLLKQSIQRGCMYLNVGKLVDL